MLDEDPLQAGCNLIIVRGGLNVITYLLVLHEMIKKAKSTNHLHLTQYFHFPITGLIILTKVLQSGPTFTLDS